MIYLKSYDGRSLLGTFEVQNKTKVLADKFVIHTSRGIRCIKLTLLNIDY